MDFELTFLILCQFSMMYCRGCNLREAPSFEQRRRHVAGCYVVQEHAAYQSCPVGLKSHMGGPNAMRKVKGSECVRNQVGQACHCCQPPEGGQLQEASGLSSGKEPSEDTC